MPVLATIGGKSTYSILSLLTSKFIYAATTNALTGAATPIIKYIATIPLIYFSLLTKSNRANSIDNKTDKVNLAGLILQSVIDAKGMRISSGNTIFRLAEAARAGASKK